MHYRLTKKITYRSSNAAGQPVPAIIIQGNFLKKFGFDVGDTLNIEYQINNIKINRILNEHTK